ncbi:hypothetical protein GCM10009119_40870 [Algoriphagus jejuensis]|uniref:Capsule assembly protein Wzi n=1 Tax=Algoriphagus jejuensis TaxID=419934 RepID=A0ABN1N5P0_9BACT
MKKRIAVAIFLLLYLPIIAGAQEKEKKVSVLPDVQFRTFWMNTSYPDVEFKDDFALGMSLNLGLKAEILEHWKFQVGYRAFANVTSSEIWRPDPTTGQANRYETGLFDILNATDRFFGQLETFSLEYSTLKFGVKAGRMGINSDWVNAQDGRLSPTAVEGVRLWFMPDSKWSFSLWGIGKFGVRGTSEWLEVGESVGVFPQGRSVEGQPGNYFGQTDSDLLAILEIHRKTGKNAKLKFSNTFAENLFSIYWLEIASTKPKQKGSILWGFQSGFQHGVGNGGNADPNLRYKAPSDRNYVLSGRLGWNNSRWITHLNYTHVGGRGRWLSPREWGKDAWYTFVPRERNEGFESVDALVAYGEYGFAKTPLVIYGHLGFHWLADMSDAAINKYNFPSYYQLNLGLKYHPTKLKNFEFHFILMNKEPMKSENLSSNQIYNKVDMIHFNGIVNWFWN